jgi:hypothetical protein
MHVPSRKLTLSGLFISLSVLLPVLFHGIGMGFVFLPMFWPVAAAAFFLPVGYAGLVGLLAPVVSLLLTGMPPLPMFWVVCVELTLLGSVTSTLYHRVHWGIFFSLFSGLVASQIGQFIAIIPIAPLLGLPSRLSGYSMVMKGLPGLALILILIPLIVAKIKHAPVLGDH